MTNNNNLRNNHYYHHYKLDPIAVRNRALSIPGCMEIKSSSISSLSTSLSTIPTIPTTTKQLVTLVPSTPPPPPPPPTTTTALTFIVGCYGELGAVPILPTTTTTTTTTTFKQQLQLQSQSSSQHNNNDTSTTDILPPSIEQQQQQQQQLHEEEEEMVIEKNPNVLARIIIYCDTGTIITCRILPTSSSVSVSSVSQEAPSPPPPLPMVRYHIRKNVTSLDIVQRSLEYPMELPKLDWNMIGMTDTIDTTTTTINSTTTNTTMATTKATIQNNIELLDVGIAILCSERDKLIQHVKTLVQQQQAQQTQPQQLPTTTTTPITTISNNSNTTTTTTTTTGITTTTTTTTTTPPTTGMEFQFSLSAGPMKHVDQCLYDISQMNKLVRWVATNGIGTIFLYGNGGVAYTPNIPTLLYTRLSQLRTNSNNNSTTSSKVNPITKHSKLKSTNTPTSSSSKNHYMERPCYVALGTKDRYFVTFFNHTYFYNKNMKQFDRDMIKLQQQQQLQQQQLSHNNNNNHNNNNDNTILLPPLSVAFGTTYDSYFIIYANGTYKYYGRGIPNGLLDYLSTLQNNNQNNNNKHVPTSTFSKSTIPSSSSSSSSSSLSQPVLLSSVTLGPAGEWFVRTQQPQSQPFDTSSSTTTNNNNNNNNSRIRYGNISKEMKLAIQDIIQDGHSINYLDFGENGSYFISYD